MNEPRADRERNERQSAECFPDVRSDGRTLGLGSAPTTSAQALRIVRFAARAVREWEHFPKPVPHLECMAALWALRGGQERLGATDIATYGAHSDRLVKVRSTTAAYSESSTRQLTSLTPP